MDKQLYLFKVELFDQEADNTKIISGMVYGSSFADVAAKLEAQYGPLLFGITYLSPCADTCHAIAEFDNSFFEQAVKELDPLIQP